MGDKTDWRLMQITESILESANEELENKDHDYGTMVTFAEILKIIQEQLTDEERRQFKLDFDIDKKYM